MPKQKRTPSVFIPVMGWIFILISGLYLPLAGLQTYVIFSMYASGLLTDDTITAFNMLEVAFYSNLRVFASLLLTYNLLFFISSIALLRRRSWARVSLSILMGLVLVTLATLGAAYVWYDYTFTAWSDPERNRRFFRIVVGLGIAGSLLLIWLIYKLNSRKIAEKLS